MRMKISFWAAGLTVLLALGFFATDLRAATESSRIRLMVLPFEVNADPDLAYLQESLPELLVDRLRDAGFSVVSREEVHELIQEQKVTFLDLDVAKDLAVLSGASYAIYGSFSQVGNTLSLDARLVEAFGIKSAKPLFVVKEGLINLLPSLDELTEKIKNDLLKKEVVADIQVEGTKALDKDVVLMRLNIQPGDIYDPKAINGEMRRIFELGYFEDIQIKVDDLPDGKRLTFVVVEKPRIQAIGVTGSDELDVDDIIAAMSTTTGSVLNLKILVEDMARVRELYRKDGYYLAKVSYELEQEEGSSQARLNIVVDEGRKLYIKEITIKGAEQLDPDDLKDEMALSERGILSWVTGSGVLKEELLERDAAALEAYYANRGFLDVKVGRPEVDFQEDGIYITFLLKEGNRYKVGTVAFKGELLETADKLEAVVEMDELARDSEYFNRSVLQDDAQALTFYYSNYGYAYAETGTLLDKNDETLTVDVDYLLKKNQKVHIRRVVLQGNDRTRDNVIRREMRLTDGSQFDGSKLKRSNERLSKLDYFESVEIEPVPTGDPSEMDLKVKVKEKATGTLSGGFGYSSYGGFFVGAKLMERNLFGKGYYTAISGVFGGSTREYVVSFTNPYYNDTKLSVGGDLYLKTEELRDFDKRTLGGRARFSYPLGEYSRLYWSYRLDKYEISDVDDDAAQVIRDAKGTHWASIGSVSAKRDTTDRLYNPTSGSVNSLSLEAGGGAFGGDDNFVKPIADTSYFHPLPWGDEHIFHWRGQAGVIFENLGSKAVPVYEKFYLGGINTVRGYRTISPRDKATGDYIGGDKEFFTNFEYLFPINQEIGLVGVGFFDAGNAWKTSDWDVGDLKKSVGTGLRWYSPMGPLRLEYAYALDKVEDQGSQHKLEFSMGQSF
jgi:outer membrane protein insertion porin family